MTSQANHTVIVKQTRQQNAAAALGEVLSTLGIVALLLLLAVLALCVI